MANWYATIRVPTPKHYSETGFFFLLSISSYIVWYLYLLKICSICSKIISLPLIVGDMWWLRAYTTIW